MADRIINPRKPKKDDEPEVDPPSPEATQGQADPELSRASAIFAASEEAQPFDPNDLGFAFEEDTGLDASPELIESGPDTPSQGQSRAKKRIFGMTVPQLAILGGMLLVWVCILIGFGIYIFLNP